MNAIHEFLYDPPLLFYVFLALLVVTVVAYKTKETLNPLTQTVLNALALQAQANVILFVLAAALSISSTADSVAEIFSQITKKDMGELGWWQIMAFGVKAVKPMFSTIAALLINPPSKWGLPGGKVLGGTAAPFTVASAEDPTKKTT